MTNSNILSTVVGSLLAQNNSADSGSGLRQDSIFRFEPKYSWTGTVVTSFVLGIITLGTALGNVFVVLAICMEKNLQSVSNYLIASLAVADLMVAILVMPISIMKEIGRVWWMGIELCDLWICFDVMCCTASILHLVAIAIDRLLTFMFVSYVQTRTPTRVYGMITVIWIVSVAISIPSRFYVGRSQASSFTEVIINGNCNINTNPGYTIFSTVGAFYLPMLFMILIYARIYTVAKATIRKTKIRATANSAESTPRTKKKIKMKKISDIRPHRKDKVRLKMMQLQSVTMDTSVSLKTADFSDTNSCSFIVHMDTISTQGTSAARLLPSPHTTASVTVTSDEYLTSPSHTNSASFRVSQRERMESKRERKAARTLAIITGCFILCWLPFFIHALIEPFCGKIICKVPDNVASLFLWLGYINSLLNPIIYTIFSPEFRNAFKKLVFRIN